MASMAASRSRQKMKSSWWESLSTLNRDLSSLQRKVTRRACSWVMMAILNCLVWHRESFRLTSRAWNRFLSQRRQLFWTTIEIHWGLKQRAPKFSKTASYKEHQSRLTLPKTPDSTPRWELATIKATYVSSIQNLKKISSNSHLRKSFSRRTSTGIAPTISIDTAMAPSLTPRRSTQTDTRAWGLRKEKGSQRLYRRQLTLQRSKRIASRCRAAL